jgi:hypothetical protein
MGIQVKLYIQDTTIKYEVTLRSRLDVINNIPSPILKQFQEQGITNISVLNLAFSLS